MKKTEFSLESWHNPGNEFRSAPFWSWNGKLEAGELKRQICAFKVMGMGGFFMHSRIGLATRYLSPEWFRLIRSCIREAEKLHMDSWLYDEDRWPSGYAGGKVTENPAYRMQLVSLTEIPYGRCRKFSIPGNAIRLFAAHVNGNKAQHVRRIDTPDDVKSGETMLVFTQRHAPLTDWYNGQCYLNPMNPDAVKKFIRLTHEAYLRNCGDEFGKRIPGIFTDEPQYGFVTTRLDWAGETEYSTPWDPQIRNLVMKRHGYDLLDRLPELFFDTGKTGFSVARLHYVGTLTDLFIKNYAAIIGKWCRDHGLCYTGHVMGEDSLAWQTWNCGSPMRFYRHFGMPGIDVLGDTESNFFIAGMLSSAGHQFGKRMRLAELYGCTGWDFPPLGHKAVGDWLLACGVNFRCQHLSQYTLAGEGKRDYPASIGPHLPWYRDYSHVENYFARLCSALTDAKDFCDILMLLPSESVWCMIRKDFLNAKDVLDFDRKFADLNRKLLRRHIAFDLGDEGVMETDACVQGGILKVGLARYSAVIVPKMLTMRENTVSLLEKFKKSGGIVIFADDPAERVDGERSTRPARLAAKCGNSGLSSLERFRKITINPGGAEILTRLCDSKPAEWLFVVNTGCVPGEKSRKSPWSVPRAVDRKKEFPKLEIRWKSSREGNIFECDPETGNFSGCITERSGNVRTIHTSLPRLGSRLFALTAEDWPASGVRPSPPPAAEYPRLPERFHYRMDSPNILIFDHFRHRLNGDAWSRSEDYVLTLDDDIRKRLGIPVRSPDMIQPWAGKFEGGLSACLELTSEFQCGSLPEGKLFIALESPELYKVSVNGTAVPDADCGFLLDHSIRKLGLPENCLRKGRNVLKLETKYSCIHTGLEAVFLCGNFGAVQEGTGGRLIPLPETLGFGSWTCQGFPFYSGGITYFAEITRRNSSPFWLKLPEFRGSLCRISCGGKQLGLLMWPPWEIDLSEAVPAGKSVMIGIEIIGSPRNMMGPFFLKGNPGYCIPTQFKELFRKERCLADCGFLRNNERSS